MKPADHDLDVSASVAGTARDHPRVQVMGTKVSDAIGAVTSAAVVGANDAQDAVVVQSLTFDLPDALASDQIQHLGVMSRSTSTGSWQVSSEAHSVDTAAKTITIESPDLGKTYTVVDLQAWADNAKQCDAAASGHSPLDVEIILQRTAEVTNADPTGERYSALKALVTALPSSSRIKMREAGVTYVSFGFGGVYAAHSGYQGMTGNASTQGVSSKRGVLDRIDELAQDPGAAHFSSDALRSDDDSDSVANGAEAAFGRPDVFAADQTNECRTRTIVFVTDGSWVPPAHVTERPTGALVNSVPSWREENYRGFRERDIPVQVLDVSDGGEASSEWLRDLATNSGGTYSFVPTAQDLDLSWIDAQRKALEASGNTTADSDGDGITDWVEVHGVQSLDYTTSLSVPSRFFSDPNKRDSDSDGIDDGDEYGEFLQHSDPRVPWTSTRPITVASVRSNPLVADSDEDGLVDAEEYDAFSPALDDDLDSDGLGDGEEAERGTLWVLYDTDSDGFSDSYEASTPGMDPTVYTEAVTGLEWLGDFSLGAFCGDIDICRRDSVPWIVGNVVSGLAIYGDVRDTIANTLQGDINGATITFAGLLPVLGDAVATAAKIVKFAKRSEDEAVRIAADSLLDGRKATEVVSQFATEFPTLISKLRGTGLSDARIDQVLKRNDPKKLQVLVSGATDVKAPSGLTAMSWRQTETWAQSYFGAASTHVKTVVRNPDGSVFHNRFHDVITPSGKVYEIKTGIGYISSKQTESDAIEMATRNSVIEYIYFVSTRTGRIGPPQYVIDRLNAAGIPYSVYLAP